MKETPILFSSEMVRAILDGRKSQTRRVMNPQPIDASNGTWYPKPSSEKAKHYANENHFKKGVVIDFCPYGKPGDQLWVKETWRVAKCYDDLKPLELMLTQRQIEYSADEDWLLKEVRGKVRTALFMPKWASRITLEITDIRVERVQDISRKDAKLEGFLPSEYNGMESWNGKVFGNAQIAFEACWIDINGKKYPWSDNPWVWVVSFKRITN